MIYRLTQPSYLYEIRKQIALKYSQEEAEIGMTNTGTNTTFRLQTHCLIVTRTRSECCSGGSIPAIAKETISYTQKNNK